MCCCCCSHFPICFILRVEGERGRESGEGKRGGGEVGIEGGGREEGEEGEKKHTVSKENEHVYKFSLTVLYSVYMTLF